MAARDQESHVLQTAQDALSENTVKEEATESVAREDLTERAPREEATVVTEALEETDHADLMAKVEKEGTPEETSVKTEVSTATDLADHSATSHANHSEVKESHISATRTRAESAR